MMPSKAQKKWATDFIAKWKDRLLLQEWAMDVEFNSEPSLSDPKIVAENEHSNTYIESVMRIYPRFWDLDVTSRELCLIHELCHCLTGRISFMMADMIDGKHYPAHVLDHQCEKLTQRIATIAYRLEK